MLFRSLFDHIKALFPKVVTVLDGSIEHQIKADRSQIEQVLINLIKNAYESGAKKVQVIINKEGELQVRDNGCGMSPDVLDHAFIPFYTTKSTGTGIGLSLCRQIILKHGGSIHVESEEGKGTTFTIKL